MNNSHQTSAMQYPHSIDIPSYTPQPQVSTTQNRSTLPIDVVNNPNSANIHIVDHSSGTGQLPMQSPVYTGLPTPPSSSRRASLQFSPTDSESVQLYHVGQQTSSSTSHLANAQQYSGSDMQSSGQRAMVQRQSMRIGSSQSFSSTAIPRRVMPATHPTVVGTGHATYSPTQARNAVGGFPAHYPLSATAVAQQNEYHRENNSQAQQYSRGAPTSYHQQSGLRRQSYNEVQFRSEYCNDTLPSGSASAHRSVPHRTVSHPAITIPSSLPGPPSSTYSSPLTPEAHRQAQTATSSTMYARPGSAGQPRTAPNSLPQSPVVPVSQHAQISSMYQHYSQTQVQGYPQAQVQSRTTQAAAPPPHQASSTSRTQYATQQRAQPQPHQAAHQAPPPTRAAPPPPTHQPVSQAPPQTHAVPPPPMQPFQQAPPAPVQPQSQQQPQAQQDSAQAQQASASSTLALPSRPATAHAQAILGPTAKYLDYAYRTALYSVARELDKQNEQFTALREANKRLTELNKGAEEERVLLRQDRTRLLEEVAALRQAAGGSAGAVANQTVERLLALCKGYDTTTQAQKAEMEKLKEENRKLRHLNNVVLQAAYQGTFVQQAAEGAPAVDPNELVLIKVGPYHAPRGLLKVIEEAIKEPIVQHYEGRLAQEMAKAQRERDAAQKERDFLSKRQSLLQELVQSQEQEASAAKASSAPSSDVPVSLIPSQPRPQSPADRPASVPLSLAAAAPLHRTPEVRAASQQPSSQQPSSQQPSSPQPSSQQPQPSSSNAPTSIQAIPTPPRTATPLDTPEQNGDPIVKAEPVEPMSWPWAAGEIIDLTLPDSPPSLLPPTLEFERLGMEALSAELDRELRAFEVEQEAVQHEEEIAKDQDAIVPEAGEGKEVDVSNERKRSLEDGTEDSSGLGVRKRMRIDGEDIEMVEGETQETEVDELESSQETAAPARPASTGPTTQGTTPSGTDTMSSGASVPPADQTVVDGQAALHQSPEPLASTSSLPAPPHVARSPAIVTVLDLPPLPTTLTALPSTPQVKNEPDEPLLSPQVAPSKRRLGIRHIDLAYHTSKTEMTCRMCFKRAEVNRDWEVKRFPISAPWADLSKHCEEVHPAGYKSLVDLDPATLAETRERLLAMDGQRGRG